MMKMPELVYDTFFSKENVYNRRKYTKLHFHNLMEIGYCKQGTGRVLFEEQSHHYETGTTNCVHGTNRHQYIVYMGILICNSCISTVNYYKLKVLYGHNT